MSLSGLVQGHRLCAQAVCPAARMCMFCLVEAFPHILLLIHVHYFTHLCAAHICNFAPPGCFKIQERANGRVASFQLAADFTRFSFIHQHFRKTRTLIQRGLAQRETENEIQNWTDSPRSFIHLDAIDHTPCEAVAF